MTDKGEDVKKDDGREYLPKSEEQIRQERWEDHVSQIGKSGIFYSGEEPDLSEQERQDLLRDARSYFEDLDDEGDQMLSGDWDHGREGEEGEKDGRNKNRGILGNIWERTGYRIIQWILLNTGRGRKEDEYDDDDYDDEDFTARDVDPKFFLLLFILGILVGWIVSFLHRIW